MWNDPVKILKILAGPVHIYSYIKKMKNLYGPTSLHLEPSNVFIQQVE